MKDAFMTATRSAFGGSRVHRAVRSAIVCAAILLPSSHDAFAADDRVAMAAALNGWYASIAGHAGDSETIINAIATDNVEIVLEDIGVTQSRAEFIESLDLVHDALDDGALAWKLETEPAENAQGMTALVCYRFADNESLVRETFSFADGMITRSVQSTVAEDCTQF